MVKYLIRGQPTEGRQHAKGIASQEKDVSGMIALASQLAVVDEIDGISGPSVLGNAIVVELGTPRMGIDHYVLQNTTKTNGIPDLRLSFLGEPNRFGVTAAFDVKDTMIRPAMFVVANEPPFRVG
jgi:hypothetical protein